jgi:serine/threonine protein kinase
LSLSCGTPQFMAPEMHGRKGYSGRKVDMWAAGVVIYYMATGSLPFTGFDETDLRQKVLKLKRKPLKEGHAVASLAEGLLVLPEHRLDAGAALALLV